MGVHQSEEGDQEGTGEEEMEIAAITGEDDPVLVTEDGVVAVDGVEGQTEEDGEVVVVDTITVDGADLMAGSVVDGAIDTTLVTDDQIGDTPILVGVGAVGRKFSYERCSIVWYLQDMLLYCLFD